jgi:hypothetical protein
MSATVADKSNDEPVELLREERRTSRLAAPVREHCLIKMGEAPVKYELTGASGHLRAEARGCGVDQLNAYWNPLAIGCAVFFSSSACYGELTACRNN